MLAMAKMWWKRRTEVPEWKERAAIHVAGFVLCGSILGIMVFEKFALGGWLTISVTLTLAVLCLWIRHYYRTVRKKTRQLDEQLKDLPLYGEPTEKEPNPHEPTAILLVENFGGVGVHSLFAIFQLFAGHFKNVVFVSVGVVDSGNFKGVEALQELRHHVERDLKRYVELARRMGLPASYEMEVGTENVETTAELCLKVAKKFPRVVVFGSKLVFQRERWYQRFMHSETATAIQNRLQWEGLPMAILPVRVFG
jgi:K+ transporter